MPLQSGDVLRTTENGKAAISFTPERTRLALGPGTELEVLGPSRGKRLRLGSGKLEASVARQRPFRPLVITTPQAEARVVGTEFSLLAAEDATRLEVTEGQVRLTRLGDAASVEVTAGHYAVAGARDVLTPLPLTGSLFREYWTNIPGNSWTYLITQTNYPDRPDGWEIVTNLAVLEMPANWADNYGQRLRGYLHPPQTGTYTFWIAARDDASLWLSPDGHPEHEVQMAHSRSAAPRAWEADPAQQSASVELIAGRTYYFEVLQKAGVGDDSLAVAWQGPGRQREVIPIKFVSPVKPKSKGREP